LGHCEVLKEGKVPKLFLNIKQLLGTSSMYLSIIVSNLMDIFDHVNSTFVGYPFMETSTSNVRAM